MSNLKIYLTHVGTIWLELAPWLLVGLLVAGLVRIWMPLSWVAKWLGRGGWMPSFWAAVLGTPLPLCSCSVLPAAVMLRRGGASRGATVSFLIATPENGADSLAMSYALLGPIMTVARLLSALVSAIATGVCADLLSNRDVTDTSDMVPETPKFSDDLLPIVDPGVMAQEPADQLVRSSQSCCAEEDAERIKWNASLRFIFFDLLNDIAGWIVIGVLAAAAILTVFPPNTMEQWGSGLVAMLGILLLGIPMYICATASTPIAAGMLVAGVSPGTVLVFLLAGPATNLASVGIVRREIGTRATIIYLLGICGTALLSGWVLDQLLASTGWSVDIESIHHFHIMPYWFAVTSGVLLPVLALGPKWVAWFLGGWQKD